MPPADAAEKLSPYIPVIVSFISGGLSGAVLNAFLTRRRQQTESTLKIIDGYFARYDDFADCKQLLQTKPFVDTPANQNRILKLGDWFTTVACMSQQKMIDRKMLLDQFGLRNQIESFRTLIADCPAFRHYLDGPWLSLKEFR